MTIQDHCFERNLARRARRLTAIAEAMTATAAMAAPEMIQVVGVEPAGRGGGWVCAARPARSVSPGLGAGSVTDGFPSGRPAAAALRASEAPGPGVPAAYGFRKGLGWPAETACLITRGGWPGAVTVSRSV